MATHVYLARWVWNATEVRWESPLRAQCIGALDLRSNTQCGTIGGTGAWGMFAYPSTVSVSGSTYLGSDFGNLNTTRRNAINNNLGVNLTANESLDKVINKLLTLNGDVTGSAKWKPLRIGKTRAVDIRFAGQSIGIGTVQDDQAEFLASLGVRKADYARQKASGVPIEILRKWNGYDLIKYWGSRDSSKLPNIVPPEFVNDGSDPPETTISDDFNRANGGIGANWTNVVGTFNISSNQVVLSAAALAMCRHNTALSGDDHKASVSITAINTSNGAVGATARNSADASPNNDCYLVRAAYAGPNIEFSKVVNGGVTALDSSQAITVSVPDTIEIEVNNSSMISRFNGALHHNFTDTSITGELRCGIHLRRTSDALDDFSAEDLAVAAARRIFLIS